jgi:hypothetical protein
MGLRGKGGVYFHGIMSPVYYDNNITMEKNKNKKPSKVP